MGKNYNCQRFSEFVDMMKDTVTISDKTNLLETQLTEDTPFENFVKLTEDNRRDRARRTEAGDETAELKFTRQTQQPSRPNGNNGQYSSAQKRPHSSGPAPSDKYARHERAPPPRSAGGNYSGDRRGGSAEGCRQWKNNGSCRFGDSCKFTHY